MPYRIESNDVLLKLVRAGQARARDVSPATRKWMQFVGRKAQRQAPVGKGRSRGALKRSLNTRLVAHNAGVLQSPLAYARIQQRGGTIRAGSGPLKSKLLTIPLSDEARKILDRLGASKTLKGAVEASAKWSKLFFYVARSGNKFLVRVQKPKKLRLTKRERGTYRKLRRGGRISRVKPVWKFLFLLKESVTLKPNPPQGYAPTLKDADVVAFGTKVLTQHLTGRAV